MCVHWGGLCELAKCVIDGAGYDVMAMLDVWTGVEHVHLCFCDVRVMLGA